ncbi:tetrapyrrole methylase family protein / MazG family protein [Desulfonispora thiosulfatigenes DSM 11270]|uniref:Tetrapyrrole methylase family protein / MazG family protein n=1 Tax=Desulfonispora thiosulfatigenes DSM 11270 TaxID=656914 RepID=A0A1W1UZC1_DESTI|nr:nucleoside triphosphate pyrophosphohydrolase [Desulfonispora thiosulfatigenes]SMB86447.1 tetrapyrrole methylase family protein / MazG family protein [Desulfonispora thiosulfatigenes DSM 11270]
MAKIIVMGLGPGSEEAISLGTINKLKESKQVFLRTSKHPVVAKFPLWNIEYKALDNFYEAKSFEEVYQDITNFLLTKAKKYGEIVYVVPGSPLVAESSVQILQDSAKIQEVKIEICPALSFLDAIYPIIQKDPSLGMQTLDAVQSDLEKINPALDALICQVYNRFVASDLKLSLMEYYPDQFMIKVIRAAGVKGLERIESIPLYQLDHLDWVDHLTTVFVPALDKKSAAKCDYPLDPLVDVLKSLLSPTGCPWDKEQTHETLKRYLLEEAYEVIDAIDNKDMNNLSEELGDLLLQIVFHSSLASVRDDFDLNDVIFGITEKMIRRHPHVFANTKVSDADEVLVNWDKIKEKEKGRKPKGLLGDIPRSMSALMYADKLQARASKVGFDWDNVTGAFSKLDEEILELKEAIKGTNGEVYDELGDVLFSIVNVARFVNLNPEEALFSTIRKFRKRFNYLEEKANQSGKEIQEFSLDQLDKWWEESKLK